jgi:hypothetical protein
MGLVTHFLIQIRTFVRDQNGDLLGDWLRVEPNASSQYHKLAAELRAEYKARSGKGGSGAGRGTKSIDQEVEDALPQDDDVPEGQGTAWPGFIAFMKDYLSFWRDVDFEDLLSAHQLLSSLVK